VQTKGKGKFLFEEPAKCAGFSIFPSQSPTSSSPSSSHPSSESESDEDSSEDEEEEDDVSQEYLDSFLEKARRSIASKAIGKSVVDEAAPAHVHWRAPFTLFAWYEVAHWCCRHESQQGFD
jgi:hypothetical protein